MEKEIDKLKKEYLNMPVPQFFADKGFDDVMERIGGDYGQKRFYFSRYAMIAVAVILVSLIGFTGITFASKPNTSLYPIKIAAQKAIANTLHITPEKVESSINKILDIKPSSAPLPTNNVLPSLKPKLPVKSNIKELEEKEIKEEDIKTEENMRGQLNIERSNNEDVKGVSTIQVQIQSPNNFKNKASGASENSSSSKENNRSSEKASETNHE